MDVTYTPTEDVVEPKSDGSGNKILFKAGTPIAWATAYALGLVTTKRPPAAEVSEVEAPKANVTKIEAPVAFDVDYRKR